MAKVIEKGHPKLMRILLQIETGKELLLRTVIAIKVPIMQFTAAIWYQDRSNFRREKHMEVLHLLAF